MLQNTAIETDNRLIQRLTSDRHVLENGLVLLITENPTADIVAARLFIDAGSRHEQPHQAGLSHLVASLFTKGTSTRTAQDIAVQVESIGANLGVSSTPDYFLVNIKTVSADFEELLTLVAELVRSPIFPEAELALERKLTLQAIRARQEQPMAIALQQLRQAIHPNHPYGLPGLGTLETVAQLKQSDLQQFHQQYFHPNTAVLSIAGNITATAALKLAQNVLGNWPPNTNPYPRVLSQNLAAQPIQTIQAQPTQQSVVMLGYPAPEVHDLTHPPLKVLYSYLCSGMSSRLFTELREKQGLAYEVSGFYPTRLHPTDFGVYLGTASENTTRALDLLKAEIEQLSKQMLSDRAVSTTKSKLLGQYALGKQSNHQIAHLYGLYEYLKLGADYDRQFVRQIEAITPTQLQEVAIRYLREPFVSIVGPETAISPLMS